MKEKFVPALAMSLAVASSGCGLIDKMDDTDQRADRLQQETVEYFDDPYLEVDTSDLEGNPYGTVEVQVKSEAIPQPSLEVTQRTLDGIVGISGNISEGGVRGSGFLMRDDSSDKVFVITAGHVVNGMDPGTIDITTNDHLKVEFTGVTYYFNDDKNNLEKSEDLAIIELAEPESFRSRALTARDLDREPLDVGEITYAFNFQQGHYPGDPAVFPLLSTNSFPENSRNMRLVGDLVPGVEEDNTKPGASGGAIVDSDGRVALMSYASNHNVLWGGCDWNQASAGMELPSGDIFLRLTVDPSENDECEQGLSATLARKVAVSGGFAINPLVEPVYLDNPDL